MNKPIFLLLLISLLNLQWIAAQLPKQTIRGIVVDKSSSTPIPFANVMVMNTSIGVQTDSLGNFVIKGVPIGRYSMKVSLLGYESYVANEVQVSSGKELVLEFNLKESINQLSEIVVRPIVNKEQPINTSASVSAKMLSVEEASRYAGGADDPARLISTFAGVASNVSNNAIVVRGNNPQSLQWKMEGVEIPNPNHFADLSAFGGGGLTALSSQLLANSDFFSGAMPAEYNNALSGVFDIYMRNGNNQRAEHTFQFGLLGIDFASEGAFKKGEKSSYLFNYRYSTLGLLEAIMPENAGGTNYQDLSFKLNFPTDKYGTFSVWGIGLRDRSGAAAKSDPGEWQYSNDKESQDVKQYMGALGVSNMYRMSNRQNIKTTLAATVSGFEYSTDEINLNLIIEPKNYVNNNLSNFVLTSSLTTKFSAKHTNKTGVTVTGLMYDMSFKDFASNNGLTSFLDENGFSTLLSAFTNSTLNLSNRLTINVGVNSQLFTLNNHYTLEPRIGLRFQVSPNQSLSFGYGLHSRLERLNYYFIGQNSSNQGEGNKNLDFSKSHQLVAGYDLSISNAIHMKVETYYQYLFNVPVIADSSFSMINQQNDLFFKSKLQNSGLGKNYGIDITIEHYLTNGMYWLISGSLFESKYKGGDGIWRDTRYNRNFTSNFLIGKEWKMGVSKKNVLGLNVRFSYQGGDHYSPINLAASQQIKEVIIDEKNSYSKQFAPAFTSHFTASYRINKQKSSQEIALKIINATFYKEFSGFRYNLFTNLVDEYREALFFPNLSYKIEF